MGNNICANSTEEKERLFKTRLSFDLSENVHLHFRDFRFVFSKEEWKVFAQFVKEVDSLKQLEEYKEGSSEHFFEIQKEIPQASNYFDGRVCFEEQANGTFHLHLHDLRFEFTKTVKDFLIGVLNGDFGNMICFLGNLSCIVYDKQKSLWVKTPIIESPVYKGLFDDFVSHDEYVKTLREDFPSDPKIVSTDSYRILLKSIQEKGFDFSMSPKVIIRNGTVGDGHHRMSILLKQLGPGKKVVVGDGKLVGVE